MSGKPSTRNAVNNDPKFAPYAYHIPPSRVLPDGPDDGLLFIRPICDAMEDSFEMEWYGEPVLDWNSFPQTAETALLIDPGDVASLCSCELEGLPPISFLRYLKSFAAQINSVVIHYQCFMWGGDIEYEVAWVFDESEVVLVSVPCEKNPSNRRTAILEPGLPVDFERNDTLLMSLQCLDVYLWSPYFVPHTRDFPWQNYRLGNME